MACYRCLVSDPAGHTAYRFVSAGAEAEAVRSFSGTGLLVLAAEPAGEAPRRAGRRRLHRGVREFTAMMELLVDSGLSLKDALDVLVRADDRKSGAGLLGRRISREIAKGASFAQAVQGMEDSFPPIYRGLVKVGDLVGSVERIFPRLNAYLGDQKKLRDKVSAALAYPALVLSAALLGIIGLVVFIMPKLESIFASFGGPSAGQIQENLGVMKTVFLFLGGSLSTLAAAVIGVKVLGRVNQEAAHFFDRRLLGLPLIGKFLSSWETLNFSFAMEVLTGGGVPVENAIPEAAALVANTAYRRALLRIRERVLNGGGLSRAFAGEKLLPSYLSQWIAIGEKSGGSEKIFSQIRFYFQGEIERSSSRFLLLIEPALILIIGAVMLALVVGIILPLFSMYGNLL
jgi:type II secretory pathway component PulF